ncbi:CNNM domain-containing protein [Limnobacter humi]|uniref:CNNM domain-containing protein n=1 Tax=Limnobacter humi TaxID=1778671 RepID=A0ABT1WKF8_9BURK|nr:CNNM domain-containing protein [Limnobacter humi]MCQ8897054.1 CNNM domain-containing protein [Limnobacter humi]
MSELPFWAQTALLVGLLLGSGFFSIAETSMMAINKYRLKAMAEQGVRSAVLTQKLLNRTDRLLSTLLLSNNLLNTATTAVVTSLAISWYGNNEWALSIATGLVAFAIIVFAEITPKVIGAAYPNQVALPASYPIAFFIRLFSPFVWLINQFVEGMLSRFGLSSRQSGETSLNVDELRSLVLESGHYLPHKQRSILMNLFELESLTVDDVMTPRTRMEVLDFAKDEETLALEIATAHHNKVPLIEEDWATVLGILHVRRMLALFQNGEFSKEHLQKLIQPAYFIPSGTPVNVQLQAFQENKERMGLVVDEYGEVLGMVTPEDILEELIGEFTSHAPVNQHRAETDEDERAVTVDGAIDIRELNRKYHLHLPTDGPRTLNGLLLEHLQDIPESGLGVKLHNTVIEIVQVADRSVKTAKVFIPRKKQPGR